MLKKISNGFCLDFQRNFQANQFSQEFYEIKNYLNDEKIQIKLNFNEISASEIYLITDILMSEYIESIDISDCDIENEAVFALADILQANYRINDISIARINLDHTLLETILNALCNRRFLKKLNLSGLILNQTYIDVIAKILKKNRSITNLDLSDSDLSNLTLNCFFDQIGKLNNLRYLNLFGVLSKSEKNDDLLLQTLSSLNLNYLNLSGNNFSKKRLNGLAFLEQKKFKELILSGNKFNSLEGKDLFIKLINNEAIQNLQLVNCCLNLRSNLCNDLIHTILKSDIPRNIDIRLNDIDPQYSVLLQQICLMNSMQIKIY